MLGESLFYDTVDAMCTCHVFITATVIFFFILMTCSIVRSLPAHVHPAQTEVDGAMVKSLFNW